MKRRFNLRAGFSIADSLAAIAVATIASVSITQVAISQRRGDSDVATIAQATRVLNDTAERLQTRSGSLSNVSLATLPAQLGVDDASSLTSTATSSTWKVTRPVGGGNVYTVRTDMAAAAGGSVAGGQRDKRPAKITVTWVPLSGVSRSVSQEIELSPDTVPAITTLTATANSEAWTVSATISKPVAKVTAWIDGQPAGSAATSALDNKTATITVAGRIGQRLEVAAMTDSGAQGTRSALTLGEGSGGTVSIEELLRVGPIPAPSVSLSEEKRVTTVGDAGSNGTWNPEVMISWTDPGYDFISGFNIERKGNGVGSETTTICSNVRKTWCVDSSPLLETSITRTSVQTGARYRITAVMRSSDSDPRQIVSGSSSPWTSPQLGSYSNLCLGGPACGYGSITGALVQNGGGGQMLSWPQQTFSSGGAVSSIILYRRAANESAPKRVAVLPQLATTTLAGGKWLDRTGSADNTYWLALQLASGVESRFSNITRTSNLPTLR